MKISVITATYNCVDTVLDCIQSVKNQSYSDKEHIVIDGASTDGTLNILNGYVNNLSFFLSESDNGIYDALNKGIKYASGDIIGFLHADDIYASDRVLEQIAEIFNSNQEISAVYGDLEYVKNKDINIVIRYWKSSDFEKSNLFWGWMPPHPTLYVRKEWYQKIGGFNQKYKISADYLSVLQLFHQTNFKSIYLPKVLIKMRLGGVSNRSLKTVLTKSLEDWLALREVGVGKTGRIISLLCKNISKLQQFYIR